MAEFRYEAKDASGKRQDGTLSAGNADEATSDLSKRGLTVVAVTPVGGQKREAAPSGLAAIFSGRATAKGARVKLKELVIFTRQLATMISAGIPLLECLEILCEQTENPGFKAVLEEIVLDVRSGTDMSSALAKHPRVFEDIYVNMVRAGEVSGQIDEILVRLAEYQEKTQKLRQQITSAMTYPVISLILIFGIVLFLLLVIIPKFKEIFAEFGVQMPWITEKLIQFSGWLAGSNVGQSIPGWVFIFALPLVYVLLVLVRKAGPGRAVTDTMVIWTPVFGGLIRKTTIAKFTRTLGTLINAGVPILEAIAITRDTSGNYVFERALQRVHDSIREGETFAVPLKESKVCDSLVVNMIDVGEETGDLDAMLLKIADNYDEEVDVAVQSMVKLIEPLLVLFLGGAVGTIVVAMFMPLVAIIEKLQSGGL